MITPHQLVVEPGADVLDDVCAKIIDKTTSTNSANSTERENLEMTASVEPNGEHTLSLHSVGVNELGQMGGGIAANPDRAGYCATAWDVVPDAFSRAGLSPRVANLPPRKMAQACRTVLLVVSATPDVEACLRGPD